MSNKHESKQVSKDATKGASEYAITCARWCENEVVLVGARNMPQCARKNQEVSGVVHNARLCVTCQHSPSGTCGSQILTTVQTFRQRFSHHPQVRVTCGGVTNSKGTEINLHSARCCDLASFMQCYPSRSRCCTTNSKPMIFIRCTIFGPGGGFLIKSAGITFVPTFFVTNLFDLEASCITSSACRRVLPCPALLRLTKHIVACGIQM